MYVDVAQALGCLYRSLRPINSNLSLWAGVGPITAKAQHQMWLCLSCCGDTTVTFVRKSHQRGVVDCMVCSEKGIKIPQALKVRSISVLLSCVWISVSKHGLLEGASQYYNRAVELPQWLTGLCGHTLAENRQNRLSIFTYPLCKTPQEQAEATEKQQKYWAHCTASSFMSRDQQPTH